MRHLAAVLLLSGALAACADDDGPASEADPDSLSRRQRDSLLGESSVPGASGVEKALDASGRARERAAQMDSVENRRDR